jgi:hypothetical protein
MRTGLADAVGLDLQHDELAPGLGKRTIEVALAVDVDHALLDDAGLPHPALEGLVRRLAGPQAVGVPHHA